MGVWELTDFFATGEAEISEMLKVADDLGEPVRRERALNFGCGVGRLSRPLAERFREVRGARHLGGDGEARGELNEDRPNCRFLVNASPDLGQLEPESVDLVYSSLILQHMPSVEVIFLHVLRRGRLAVFHALSHIPLALRLQPRRRVYAFLRSLGISEQLLMMRSS